MTDWLTGSDLTLDDIEQALKLKAMQPTPEEGLDNRELYPYGLDNIQDGVTYATGQNNFNPYMKTLPTPPPIKRDHGAIEVEKHADHEAHLPAHLSVHKAQTIIDTVRKAANGDHSDLNPQERSLIGELTVNALKDGLNY